MMIRQVIMRGGNVSPTNPEKGRADKRQKKYVDRLQYVLTA